MPIPHSAAKEFFYEYKERSFISPDEDDPAQDLNILAMLFSLLTRTASIREAPQHRSVITYTIIEIGQSNSNSTVVLVENRFTHRNHHNESNSERPSYSPPMNLSTPEDSEGGLNNFVY